MALLRPLTGDGEAGEALALLRGWDIRIAADSGPCALYQVWWMRHLRVALLERLAPDPNIRALLQPGDMSSLIAALEKPDARFGADPILARKEMLFATLAAAWRETSALLGSEPARWAWGDLHKMRFDHALGTVDSQFQPAAPALPMGGDATNPMLMWYRPSDFNI